MTRLWLVRHGPTHAQSMIGWTDLDADLSDTAQIARLAAQLPHAPVITSDLKRTVQTADALALPGPRLPAEPGLREIHFGAWENQSFDAIHAAEPARIEAYWDDPGDTAPEGGESWNAFSARVDAATDRLCALGHDDLIVVSHFGVIVRHIQRARALTGREAFGHRIANLSLTRITARPGGWHAGPINHTP